jgi:hypothetical protein
MRNPLLKQCTKMTIFIKQRSLILYCKYHAFYHVNTSQQMHKIIDIYIYIYNVFESPTYVSANELPSSGGF